MFALIEPLVPSLCSCLFGTYSLFSELPDPFSTPTLDIVFVF
uniref:Uncharacterized protein n=1 Tax=Arundo donax TaxID=35708 RepID=A0A0A9E8P9_ARUDO